MADDGGAEQSPMDFELCIEEAPSTVIIANGDDLRIMLTDANNDLQEVGRTLENVSIGENSSSRAHLTEAFLESYANDTRGMCVIISNEKFDAGAKLADRVGAQHDVATLEHVWRDTFNFDLRTKKNLTVTNMRRYLEERAEKMGKKYHDCSCLVVVLLSHGADGDYIYGTDGGKISMGEVVRHFDANHCPAMRDKPKLFIVQACRGDITDYGHDGPVPDPVPQQLAAAPPAPLHARRTNGSDDSGGSGSGSSTGSDGGPLNVKRLDGRRHLVFKASSESDMVVAYSGAPGYQAWRSRRKGSVFIQTLCAVFVEHAEQYPVLEMLTKVNSDMKQNYEVKDRDGAHVMGCSQTIHSLTKAFYLPLLKRDVNFHC